LSLPKITSQDLRRYRSENEEVRVETRRGENAQEEKSLRTTPGSWFKRVIRLLSIPFRAPDKKDQYEGAKLAVLAALKSEFGEQLGTKVFRANIGETEGGRHFVSPYDPITGREIRKMVEQGDREILEHYAKEENGGVNYSGLWSTPRGGPVPGRPDPATRDWMMAKFENKPSLYNRAQPPNFDPFPSWRDVDLRSSRVDTARDARNKETFFQSTARGLLTDLDRRIERTPSDRGHAWTLDIDLMNEHGGRSTTTLGLRVDPKTPDMINIFDVNHCEVTVARKDLSAWLRAHIEEHYPDARLSLFRAEEVMSRNFPVDEDDGVPKARFDFELDDKPLQDELIKKYEKVLEENGPGTIGGVAVSSILQRDINRSSIEIKTPDRSYGLGPGNFYDGMKALLDDGNLSEEQLRLAIYNLSVVLNQDLGTEGCKLYEAEIKERLAQSTFGRAMDCTFELSRTNDNPPAIRIDVDMVRGYQGMGGDMLKDWEYFNGKSHVETRYSVSIELDHLLEDEGWRKLAVTEPMRSQGVFQPQLDDFEIDEHANTKGLGLFQRDGRLQTSMRLQNITVTGILQNTGDKPVSESRGVMLNQQFLEELGGDPVRVRLGGGNGDPLPLTLDHVEQVLPGLGPLGKTNLSHLLAPSTGITLFESMTNIDEIDPDTARKARTIVTPIARDGVNSVDIEYRCPVPQGALEGNFFLYPEPPTPPGHFESVVRVRIPVDQLNNGIPQTYDMLQPSRFEWIGDEN
jgi:hypothetical protein